MIKLPLVDSCVRACRNHTSKSRSAHKSSDTPCRCPCHIPHTFHQRRLNSIRRHSIHMWSYSSDTRNLHSIHMQICIRRSMYRCRRHICSSTTDTLSHHNHHMCFHTYDKASLRNWNKTCYSHRNAIHRILCSIHHQYNNTRSIRLCNRCTNAYSLLTAIPHILRSRTYPHDLDHTIHPRVHGANSRYMFAELPRPHGRNPPTYPDTEHLEMEDHQHRCRVRCLKHVDECTRLEI